MIQTLPTLCGSVAGSASGLGVKMHNAGYADLGIDFTYVAIGTDELGDVMSAMRHLRMRGLGVSMPFKQEVIGFLDDAGPDVRAIGACNTVVNENGRLVGHNTDWIGAMRSLQEAGVADFRRALVVGAGGAARAVAYGLRQQGPEVFVAARRPEQAFRLSEALGLSGQVDLEDQGKLDADLLVNATPMASPDGPLALADHDSAEAILDVVFQPRTTPLIAAARERRMKCAAGWRMLLHQAMFQFELYTQSNAPTEAMERVLESSLPA